jgi:hypothetical protein
LNVSRTVFAGMLLLGSVARAQTVTGSGTSNTVPKFSGTSTLGNSPISISGSNVGIGTPSPTLSLHVNAASAAPASSGNATGQMLITGGGTYATVFGTVDSGTQYSWIQGQYRDSAAVTRSLVLQPVGGNIGIGTTGPSAKLEINGNVKLTSGSGASLTFADGSVQSTAYTGVTCGGDYAESVDVSGDRTQYEPGDVLVIDPDVSGKFLKSAEPYSTAVTGIYSTRPGTVGRRQEAPKSSEEVPMAMIGIVPTKVSAENGPIHRGDLLVSSSTIGYAMKGTDRNRLTGAVIGKALGNLEDGKGVVEVVVTLQ